MKRAAWKALVAVVLGSEWLWVEQGHRPLGTELAQRVMTAPIRAPKTSTGFVSLQG
jgi:hypothetical protein